MAFCSIGTLFYVIIPLFYGTRKEITDANQIVFVRKSHTHWFL